jgi:hypothetical protein
MHMVNVHLEMLTGSASTGAGSHAGYHGKLCSAMSDCRKRSTKHLLYKSLTMPTLFQQEFKSQFVSFIPLHCLQDLQNSS